MNQILDRLWLGNFEDAAAYAEPSTPALLTLLAQQRDTSRTHVLEGLIRHAAAQEGLWRALAAHRPQERAI